MNSKIRLLITKGYVAKLLSAVIFLMMVHSSLKAQQSITGKIISSEDQSPLPGVSVTVPNSSQGVTSKSDGTFTIQAAIGSKLNFSIVGYLSKEVTVTGANLGNISLEASIKALDTVVVVGYGTQKKVNLTGAVTTVNMSDKEGQPITNVSNALHGAPGLFVNLGNSQPGVDRSTIRIRGIGTLNNNDPLVLVDGIEYSMDELNPADIASISVLKDASAAIYGSRAANGVILVTTKTGRGPSKVNYDYYYGIQKPTFMPDAIWDPIAYMKLKNQAVLNEGQTQVNYSDDEIAEYEAGMKTDPYTYPANNWFDIALENGIIRKHDVSVSGSSDKYQYRLSLGFLDREGIMIGPGNNDKRYSLGLNTSVNVSKRLKVGLTFDGYYRKYTQPFYNSFWQYLTRTLPILTDTLADGRYGDSWLRTPGRNNWENPRMIAYTGYGHKTVQRFVTSIYADYKLPFDITYSIKFGADKYDGLLEEFTPQVKHYNPKTGAATNWNSPTTAPRAANTDYADLNLHFYNTLNWHRRFNDAHNIAVMVGASYDDFGSTQFSAGQTGYLDATLTAIDAGTERYSSSGHSTDDVLESYFGRLNYDFKGKYLLDATFREDGSSRFAPGHRWGFFPGVSAGWRIDKESFFNLKNIFSLLKLRASVGELGNQAVPLYSYENSIDLGKNYSFGGVLVSGAAATAYTDPNITWETTTTYDVGLDADLFKSKLSVTADVYKKRTTDILREVNIPAQIGGLVGPQENIGTMENTGYELTLEYRNSIGNFNYSVNGSVSYNKNKVVDIDGQILYDYNTNISTITEAGYPINSYYLLDAIGIFQSDDEVQKSAFQSNSTKAGYLKYRDVNGDGIINGDDRIIINTSTIIPKYTYGFGVDMNYKGFALTAFFQGVSGIKVYPTANLAFPFNNGADATWEWATDSWTPERTNAKLPIVTESTGGQDNFQPSTFWLRDGSYLRLKNIQLSYMLPQRWLKAANISKFSVFVNAENWVTFSKYKDFDPESILNASTLYHYPMLKTFSGGVQVIF
jgi:TonB-linked SusC/RagA family outer membrane protein